MTSSSPPPRSAGFGPQGPPQGPPAPGMLPPPPPGVVPVVKAPPIAWLIPLAALLSVVGAAIPWFRPHADKGGQRVDFDALYSVKDGKIGLIAPIALVIVALGVIGLARGKVRGRLASSADPVRSMAKYAIGAGVAAVVCVLIAWLLVTTQYKFELGSTEYSWGDFERQLTAHGATLSRGPQPGYWLTSAAALLAVIAGVVLLVQTTPSTAARTAVPSPPPPPGGYPPAGPPVDTPSG